MNKNKILFIFLVVIMLCTIATFGITLSKYIKEKNNKIGLTSDKYYFTIDLLGNTNEINQLEKTYTLYGGDSKEIDFYIQNYFDELRITKSDITYSATVVEGSDYASINLEGTQTLIGNTKNETKCTLFINEGYPHNTSIKVKVSSSLPYQKDMFLNFVLYTYESNIDVKFNDSVGSMYLELIIDANINIPAKKLIIDYSSINNISDKLKVDLTNNYLLDDENQIITNKISEGSTYLKSITITKDLSLGEAISIYFFKEEISVNYASLEYTILSSVVDSEVVYTITLSEGSGE